MTGPLRCGNCGALLGVAATCAYCGAVSTTADGDLIAAGFGAGDTSWAVPSGLASHGILLEATDRELAIEVPAATELGEAIVPAAFVRGAFADVDVAAAIAFAAPAPDGLAAGFWLRNDEESAITVMQWPSGAITISARRDAGARHQPLGRVEPPAGFVAAGPHVLRARLVADLITVARDGRVVASVPCPLDLHGTTELRVQVADRARAQVRFADPSARLP